MRIIGPDGVLRLASVTGDDASMGICAARPNLEHVLGNRVLFGTVSANRVDFVKGVEHLAEARRRFPGWLTRRAPLNRLSEGFERKIGDVKVVVEVSS